MTTSPRLVLIRELVDQANPPKSPSIAVQAMNEKELVDFIFRWDTNLDQAEDAYQYLRNLTGTKYGDLSKFN